MHALEIIGKTIDKNCPEYPSPEYKKGKNLIPLEKSHGVCCVTGIEGECYPRDTALSESFTNYDLLAAPRSQLINCNVWIALKYKWQRMSCFYCDETTFKRIDVKTEKPFMRDLLFNPPKNKLWLLYITTSYKKHGGLLAPVNFNTNKWLFETLIVDVNMDYTRDWWEKLNYFLNNNISRPQLENYDIYIKSKKLDNIKINLEFLEWAKNKYKTPLYKLLCYLLPSKEELNSGGTKDASNI
jgi:hypothetical protein